MGQAVIVRPVVGRHRCPVDSAPGIRPGMIRVGLHGACVIKRVVELPDNHKPNRHRAGK